MINPFYWMPVLMPNIPIMDTRPPKLYDLMDSIVNYGKTEKVNPSELAKASRTTIFAFDYELTDKIDKEKFECMILNHFINRRIGFETFTLFQIQLNVKLNEIMPLYNKMFDSISGWNIFEDGEKITRNVKSENELNNTSETSGTNIEDLRYSDTPQNRLENLKDASYVTDANYNQRTNKNNDKSNSKGNSTSDEVITRTPSDKIAIYKEFQENMKNIYSMIFKDLECLFYQLI